MPLNVRNLDSIRSFKIGNRNIGQKIYEALTDIITGSNQIEQQTNSAAHTLRPAAPPQISAFNVTGQNGHFNLSITDNNQNIYSGIKYYVEHSDNPGFSDPQYIDLGTSRNHSVFLGNVGRYWRAYSSYATSPPSSPVYHGGPVFPKIVMGGGSIGGPAFQPSQGSGTGAPGEGLAGPGPIAYRTVNGKPPVRS